METIITVTGAGVIALYIALVGLALAAVAVSTFVALLGGLACIYREVGGLSRRRRLHIGGTSQLKPAA